LALAGTGMFIEVAAFAGIAKSDINKVVTNKVEIFFDQELLMMFSYS
jgi:predicted XRE-type DNA-binding protein